MTQPQADQLRKLEAAVEHLGAQSAEQVYLWLTSALPDGSTRLERLVGAKWTLPELKPQRGATGSAANSGSKADPSMWWG